MIKLSPEEKIIHKKISQKKYYEKNREKIREWKRQERIRNKEKYKIRKHNYYLKNKSIFQQKRKVKQLELKKIIIQHYSPNLKCANCGLNDLKNLTIDHINGKGGKHRKTQKLSGGYSFYYWLKKLNFPSGFQVLCFACNMAKGNKRVI